ncbi:molybdenum cofactor biosynthesis protein MoaB [Macrococcus hajekii]|uniref:Molybdenum cofactor biosynthesis protein B n=1 Tax=Macrococcus hajekii TaxID=198482 RepID=A0A4R6BJQ3_9STAP|nr:molybdenum cofactor biosynthesis protein B [Macrococcus hajekii]TDM01898.1 molybdenum cofactor biosynthesis protein MoaB [Macrococcus hajekii]GGB08378.1 molybdenum cofactor biosynthesis protein B [Macrococcus hajekii]
MHTNDYKAIKAAVITVSDTRTEETDKGGRTVISHLEESKIEIAHYSIVKDDYEAIQAVVQPLLKQVDVIITTGGTGVAQRDVTIEAVRPLVDKEMEGFGEIFRYLSYTEDVGTRAILSRAFCGTYAKTVIFSIPGSVGAVNLAMKKLITQEVFHIVHELNK